jgi:ketosteroid isomerase-like protein
MLIESSCRRLLMRYATSVDRKDYDTYMSVFAPEAIWRRPGQPPLTGAVQIRKFFDLLDAQRRTAERPTGHLHRHLFTTVHIDVLDANTARGIAYALVFREENPQGGPASMRPPEMLVQYDDLFRKTADGWLIYEHDISHVFRVDSYANNMYASVTAAVTGN